MSYIYYYIYIFYKYNIFIVITDALLELKKTKNTNIEKKTEHKTINTVLISLLHVSGPS